MSITNKLLLVFITFLFSTISIAQNKKIDSLKLLLKNHTKEDSTKVNLLNDISFENYALNTIELEKYAKEANSLAKKIKYTDGEARSLYLIGVFFFTKSELNATKEYVEKAIHLFNLTNNKIQIAKCYSLLGSIKYYKRDYNKALKQYNKALTISRIHKDTLAEADFLNNIGNVYYKTGEFDKAIKTFNKTILLYESINLPKKALTTLTNMSSLYTAQGKYLEALAIFKKSLNINQKTKNEFKIAADLLNIGSIYSHLNDFETAVTYFQKSLKIYKNIEDQRGVYKSLVNIGIIARKKGNYKKALLYINNALEIGKKINDKESLYYCYNNIGDIHFLKNNFKGALNFYKKAIDISISTKNDAATSSMHLDLSKVYFPLKNIPKAFYHAKKGNAIANDLNLLEEQKKASHLLSQLYKKKGNYKKAYENQVKFKTLSDSLFNKENIKKITQLEYKYEYKERIESAEKRELKLTEEVKTTSKDLEDSQSNFFISIITFLAISILLLAGIFFLRIKNIKVKNDSILTEQKLLRSQMTPHFIFNSLAVLQGIILNKEEKKSISYLNIFSKLLRLTLENSRDNLVSLINELKAIENYIALLNIDNINNPYKFKISLEETIDVSNFMIPPMLIQPFIENAVEHAFINKKENKEITINIHFKNGDLTCIITDNGIGINASKKNSENKNISLATTITTERLEILSKEYKTKGSLLIIDRENEGKNGTIVTITIPFKLIKND